VSVRVKIVLVVVPLLILALAAAGLSSALAARNGLTAVAVEFLGFKAEELETFAGNQWALLVNNGLEGRDDLVEITRQSVGAHAAQMTRSAGELVFAVTAGGDKAFANRPLDLGALPAADRDALKALAEGGTKGWISLRLAGTDRVGFTFPLKDYRWQVLVTDEAASFYAPVNQILWQTAGVLAATVVLSVLLLVFFAGVLTRPLAQVAAAMDRIISSGQLNQTVEVRYRDEIGRLAHTFNLMTAQLDGAYRQVKAYALEAVVARRNEAKIRQIFQKYVPANVIDQFFANPEKMLVGDVRQIAILFTDIRSFTTISESYKPDELVNLLNQYFSILVEIIIGRHGVVDKYIGDAVMAFFGAPARYENDARDALEAGLAIVAALETFNSQRQAEGRVPFLTGIGINFGEVTVGNIGTDKKMDYTVIGDNVNLASRLEGLTKEYKQSILISRSLTEAAGPVFPYRLVDTVIVKGKTTGERIYTAAAGLSPAAAAAWELHNRACDLFYARDFAGAGRLFAEVGRALPGDHLAELFGGRCRELEKSPPPEGWNGTVQMDHK